MHLFDIGQTDGPELPTVDVRDVQDTAHALLTDLVLVADRRNIRIDFAQLSGGLYGVSKGGSADVNNTQASEWSTDWCGALRLRPCYEGNQARAE